MDGTIPIIRVELEKMKYTLQTALLEHQALMDEQLQIAVNDFFQEENITRIIERDVHRALENAITEEISKYFLYGDGREKIREAIKEYFIENEDES